MSRRWTATEAANLFDHRANMVLSSLSRRWTATEAANLFDHQHNKWRQTSITKTDLYPCLMETAAAVEESQGRVILGDQGSLDADE